tara:strand:- start:6136 stop:6693 length:558 start_codon:yes stop_codon:yes gene_type:complete
MNVVKHQNNIYPEFQTKGNAAQFAIPFAKHICKGYGLDIGAGRRDWALPNSVVVDPEITDWDEENNYDAYNLPPGPIDFIFSSHCLEHLEDWVYALQIWTAALEIGGDIFLYLPDYSQTYWRPWHNRHHLNIFTPTIIRDFLEDHGYTKIFVSGIDLNNSFIATAEKQSKSLKPQQAKVYKREDH